MLDSPRGTTLLPDGAHRYRRLNSRAVQVNQMGRAKGQAMTRVLIILTLSALLIFGGPSPGAAQFTLTGGSNGVLGVYLSAGRILRPDPQATLTLGLTYTDALGTEPLVSLTTTRSAGRGWNLVFTTAYGGLGGDYRVDRLPEVSFNTGGGVPGTRLTYGVDVGIANYVVRPTGVNGYRLHSVVQFSTPAVSLGPLIQVTSGAGYRQYAYAAGLHGAGWGTVQVSLTPAPTLSATLTYFRQVISGSSPLLFDALGQENYISGGVTFRASPAVALTHSQTYSFLTGSISARVYGASVALQGGQALAVSWDDVPRNLSLSYSRSGLGSLSVTWEVPIDRVTFSFSR